MKLLATFLATIILASVAHCAPVRPVSTPVERAFEDVKNDPGALRVFLAGIPKGADLHLHLSGAVYAESLIDAGAHDLLCVDIKTMTFVANKGTTRSLPSQAICGDGHVRASDAYKDQKLYDGLVNSFSMRSFVPSAGVSAHDQFFATFGRFAEAAHGHTGEWIDEVVVRASRQNEQYLEIMHTPDFPGAMKLAASLHWEGDVVKARDTLRSAGLQEVVAADVAEFDAADRVRMQRQHCGNEQASAPCKLQVRYLFQVLRAFSPEQVFTQALLGMEVATADPRVVGINFVQPEDMYGSMSQYAMEMRIVGTLHALYPKVHISLHAGELAQGLVAADGLRFHIRDAVEVAHAERIGHGVDVMYEDDANGLLRELATKHVMVEINLTSNDVILGVKGKQHPLANYRMARVPVALSTDDEGVSRIDLTTEYVRAVIEQGLGYQDLKQMARTSMEHTFLPGESLWASADDFSRLRGGCAARAEKASSGCEAFLETSEHAAAQWELERRFRIFEAGFAEGGKR